MEGKHKFLPNENETIVLYERKDKFNRFFRAYYTLSHKDEITYFGTKYYLEKIIFSEKYTIIELYSEDGQRKIKGISKCHPDDKFSPYVGYEVAYDKLRIKCLKEELKYLQNQFKNKFVHGCDVMEEYEI